MELALEPGSLALESAPVISILSWRWRSLGEGSLTELDNKDSQEFQRGEKCLQMWKFCCVLSSLCLWWVGQKQQVGMGRESLQVEDQTHRLGTMFCVFITQGGGSEQWPVGRARRTAGDVAAWTSILPHPTQHSWGELLPPPQPLCTLGQVGLITQAQAHTGWSSQNHSDWFRDGHASADKRDSWRLWANIAIIPGKPSWEQNQSDGDTSFQWRHLSTWTQFIVADWISQRSHTISQPICFHAMWPSHYPPRLRPVSPPALWLIWPRGDDRSGPGQVPGTAINCLEASAFGFL